MGDWMRVLSLGILNVLGQRMAIPPEIDLQTDLDYLHIVQFSDDF